MEVQAIYFLLIISLIPFLIFLVDKGKYSRFLSIISGLAEFSISLYLAFKFWSSNFHYSRPLLEIGSKTWLDLGFWINNYSLSMIVVIALVSLMVRIYSFSYMKSEDRSSWFMVLISFFTFSMYGIALSSNLLSIFFFWEWVGLASYLMIGFWYKNPSAANAAKKAFLFNKVGDLGFIMALAIFYFQFESFQIPEILSSIESGNLNAGLFFGLGISIAAFAKSAQLPLSSWLADAMEGPTPASALIHSATMVTAGIYLMIRLINFLDPAILDMCLYVATVTVLWAGLSAVWQSDIKKLLAYSTISQLGFMLLGLASGNAQAAFFHLITHAFFKASLFLSAGLIISEQKKNKQTLESGIDPQNLVQIQGLFTRRPILVILTILGALALSAIPFFSGFLSKEAILSGLQNMRFVFVAALIGSFLTALYCGRLIFHLLKPGSAKLEVNSFFKDAKSNFSSYFPVLVLVILSFSFFYTLNPFDFASSWLYKGIILDVTFVPGELSILFLSTTIALAAFIFTFIRISRQKKDLSISPAIDKTFENALFLDLSLTSSIEALKWTGQSIAVFVEEKVINRSISFFTYAYVFTAMIFRLFDTYVVDGFVNLIALISSFVGDTTRRFQGGSLQSYLFWLILFLALGLIILF